MPTVTAITEVHGVAKNLQRTGNGSLLQAVQGVVGLAMARLVAVVGEPDLTVAQLAAMPSPPTASGTVTLPSGVREPSRPTR